MNPFDRDFGVITEFVAAHAQAQPARRALDDGRSTLSWAELDALVDRTAATLQQRGVAPGEVVAICAETSTQAAAVFLGALRAGAVVAPLAPGAAAGDLERMLDDAGARCLFTDAVPTTQPTAATVPRVALDDNGADAGEPLSRWLAAPGTRPQPVQAQAAWPFNIIYSSGTTGRPKGIVQSHGMRWMHVRRGQRYGWGPDAVALLATPLYSNTTLVAFLPAIAWGATVLLSRKFDAGAYLERAAAERVTHTMLVPVQYQRLLARPDFDRFDLASFRVKFCTSAPFAPALKAEVLRRWPGGLVEFYGMTEGGLTCILEAHEYPGKLHTVGRPSEGHVMRLIDEHGRELPPGDGDAIGEIVGHSPAMMTGYHRRPDATRDAEWHDAEGRRYIRTGDIGRVDAEGFVQLLDRRKDMVISGGFNIYPSDLEAVLREHPAVAEAAVFGVPSRAWGETPVACVVLREEAPGLLAWCNARVGKTQRLAALDVVAELPRSAIGKVLKRELRERWLATHDAAA